MMSTLKFVNSKICNNKVVLNENLKIKWAIQVFFFPRNWLLAHSFHSPFPYPHDTGPFLWLVISFLIFSSIFSPMWQLSRKLLVYQKCPRTMLAMGPNPVSSGSLEWEDEIPALNYPEDLAVQQTQHSLLPFNLAAQRQSPSWNSTLLSFVSLCYCSLFFYFSWSPFRKEDWLGQDRIWRFLNFLAK